MPNSNRPGESRAKRGFAAMDPEERRKISRRGGEASHRSGRGHEFNSEEAREAGRRGGEARWGRSQAAREANSEAEEPVRDEEESGETLGAPRRGRRRRDD